MELYGDCLVTSEDVLFDVLLFATYLKMLLLLVLIPHIDTNVSVVVVDLYMEEQNNFIPNIISLLLTC